MLRLRVFGGLTVELDGDERPAPGRRRARSLLGWLAVHEGMHTRSKIAGTFWPDVLEESARGSLRAALTEIRHALGPAASDYLVATRGAVGLAGDPQVWTDVAEFDRLAAQGRLADAVELGEGELLAGIDDEWVYEARERHRDRVGELLEQLATSAEERRDMQAAIRWSRRRAELDPLSEAAGRNLIRRLAAGGDRAAAMAAYARLGERLRTTLGIAPSPETRELAERLRAGAPEGVAQRADDQALVHLFAAPLLDEHEQALLDMARRHGGRGIARVQGGLAVQFVSAAAASDCAVAMQRAVERERRGAEGPGIRVALYAGEAGAAPADSSESRVRALCEHAEPGQVLVSDLVRRLVEAPRVEGFREVGTLAGPVAVSELLWAGPDGQRAAPPTVVALEDERPFVGRRESLDRLWQVLEQARAGRGRLVLLSGEPGIGKTRLVARVGALAHAEGVPVLVGRCFGEPPSPYEPWVEALGPYLERLDPAQIDQRLGAHGLALARLFPELAPEVLRQTLDRPPDTHEDRLRLFGALATVVSSASRPHGLLLVLEDLHAADQPTLLALRWVLRGLPETAALVLATYRDSDIERHGALMDLLADAARDTDFEHLALGPLQEPEVAGLVAAVTGRQAPPDLSETLHAHSDGNPFFVIELARHLEEAGLLEQGRLTAERIASAGLPERVKLVLGQRLARLPELTQRLLAVAAVAGREFEFDLLEEVSELSGDALADALDEASAVQLIEQDPERQGRYRFSHSLIRDALYERVGTSRAALLHARIGAAVERLHAGALDEYVAPLAYHFCEAARPGDVDRAVEYAARAGRAAMGKLAFEEAAAHYERALRALALAEPVDEARRCELLLALGDAQGSAAGVERWRATFLEAAELAERIQSPEALARAAVGFGGRYAAMEVGVVNESVVELLEKALAGLQPRGGPLEAEVMARLAEALTFAPHAERRESLARKALQIARDVGDPLALARVLSRAVWATWSPDGVDQRLALTRQFTRLAEECGDHRLAAQGHSWLYTQLLELGEIDAALGEMDWHQRQGARIGDSWRSWITAVYRANQALFEGRFDQVEALAREALELGQAAQNANAAPMFGAQLLVLRGEQARLAEAVPALEQFVERMPLIAAWRTALANAYAEAGRHVEARQQLELVAAGDFADIPRDVLWTSAMHALAETVALLRDRAYAERVYELLLPYGDRCVVLVVGAYLGPVARLLGRLAAVAGWPADAARHFEHAMEISTRVGSEPWLATTRHEYAELLLAEGCEHAARARELAAQALASADRLGMPALKARARRTDFTVR